MSNNNISIYDARGYFHTIMSVLDEEVGDVLIDEHSVGCVEGSYDGSTHWWNGINVAARPDLPLSSPYSVPLGGTLVIPGLPVGTKVVMNGMLLGVTEQPEEPLLFEDAGSNVLTLDPFPFKVTEMMVNVL